jgi:hypothetical protein
MKLFDRRSERMQETACAGHLDIDESAALATNRDMEEEMRGRGGRFLLLLTLASLLVLALAPGAQASRYVGNYRSPGYGVKADITTPSQQPLLYDWESSWVSTEGPDWVQTGWAMYVGWAYPKSYVETNIGSSYDMDWYSNQTYNFSRLYEVVHIGNGTWRALIAGTSRGTWGPISYPREVQALSEVQADYRSALNAKFTNIQYKGQYQYFNFDQDHRWAEAPYYLEWFYTYRYNTHGNGL